MTRLCSLLIDHRRFVVIVVVVLSLLSAVLIPAVSVNYDLAEYLPEELASRIALDKLKAEFGYDGSSSLMATDISLSEAQQLKARLQAIDGVKSVLWLDDVADLTLPLEYIDSDYLQLYYQDNCALYMLSFDEDNYSLTTGDALVQARELAADYDPAIYGTAEESRNTRLQVRGEMGHIMLLVVPACLLILILISSSWLEPLLYISVICVAVLLNMGSNLIFDNVSFIIFSMGAAIQLAVSMDYSLFLTHRFEEERQRGLDERSALIEATRRTFPSIFASALTTVAGFTSLALMQYGIGRDIGFVLAKGVTLSFLCVIFFLPPLLYIFLPLINKTRHKTWLHISERLARRVTKLRYVFIVLTVALLIPAVLGTLNVRYLYGDSSGSSTAGQIAAEKARIQEHFELNDQLVAMFPSGRVGAERELAQRLQDYAAVDMVQGLVTLADPTLPQQLLPTAVTDNFSRNGWGRMIVYVNTVDENQAMFDCLDYVESCGRAIYGDDFYLVGKAASVRDIRDSVQSDLLRCQLFSILAVGAIILLTFRSLLLPIILVAAIESAVYFNMSVPYFLDQPLVFIGYLVVSSLQLGATIDYAILLTSRYVEARRELLPRDAAAEALRRSGVSVVTSGLILTVAGVAEYLLSSMAAISAIGMLIGRGAGLSMLVVLLTLPGLLTLLDRPIRWLTWKADFLRTSRRWARKKE